MKLTEQQLRDVIKEVIEENFFDNMYRGFPIKKEEPTNYQEVFARCGYKIVKESGNRIYATQMMGAFGAFNGDSPKEVPSALARIGVNAKFLGCPKGKQYIFVFEIAK